MTDADKVDALTELLSNVIHSLEMTKYEIEDVTEAANVVREADNYHQQMLNILYPYASWLTVHQTHQNRLQCPYTDFVESNHATNGVSLLYQLERR